MRSARTLWAGLAALALAGGLVWLAWPRVRPAAGSPVPETRAAPTPEREAELGMPRSEEQRAAPPADVVQPAGEPTGIRIVVVDEAGAPVGGVPVGLAWGHPRLPFTQVITAAATGADGTATLALPSTDRAERRLLAAVLLPGPPAIEQELASPRAGDEVRFTLPDVLRGWLAPLSVQALDAAGQPVSGAVVAFRTLLPDHPGTSGSHLGGFDTDSEGRARIDRAGAIDQLRHARPAGVRLAFELAIQGPYAEPPRRVLTEAEIGSPPPEIVLVLPPTGRVEVSVHDALGREPKKFANVGLTWSGGRLAYAVENGRVTFERVGLGLELELEAWQDDHGVERSRASLRGPVSAGESVHAELVLGAPCPMLVGRLVDAAGAPCAEMRFSLSFHHRSPSLVHPPNLGSSQGGPTRVDYSYHVTDGDGRFVIPLASGAFGPRHAELVESAPRSGPPPGWVARFACADLPDPLQAGQTVDIGDLTLAPLPLLASGTIVDGRGAPVVGAWLAFEYPLGLEGERKWYVLSRATSDATGAFELHHLLPVPILRVSAGRDGVGVAEPVLVPPGASRVQLVLVPQTSEPVGRLHGRLLLDEGLDPTLLAAHCRYANGGRHDSYVLGGHFAFAQLPAGEVEVEIRTYDTDWLVARVAGVQILAGAENTDARLDALDLRGELRYLRLRLVAPDGKPLAGQLVWLRTRGEGGSALCADDEGRLVALTRARDTEFELSTNEFEPVRVVHADSEQELVLDPRDGR